MSIADRAMLARPRISLWAARKLDKHISAETNRDHGAQAGAAKVYKQLIAHPSLDRVAKIAGQFRSFHMDKTLAWLDDGSRVLPASLYLEYNKVFCDLREEFHDARDEFSALYPGLRHAAQGVLGSMWRMADYPHPSRIAERFSMSVHIAQIDDGAGDWRVKLGNDHESALRQQTEAAVMEAMRNATRDAWTRLAEPVARMAERLKMYRVTETGIEAPFRDSLVENVREICDLMPRLNIMGDAHLDAMARKVRECLAAEEPASLRVNDAVREDVARSAADILAEMDGLYEVREAA